MGSLPSRSSGAATGVADAGAVKFTAPDGSPTTATLPTEWYLSPEVWRLERERIFGGTWQYVGHVDRLARAGDFVCASLGDTPIVVTRDRDGALHALVNVCRHRLHEVASGEGNRGTLQCPYHAWTYDLDGSLRAAPRSDREPDFDPEQHSLLRARIATLGPLVFACADQRALPFEQFAGSFEEFLSVRELGLDRCRMVARRTYDMRCNWKTYVENAVECYHCPVAHKGLSSRVDVRPEAYRLEAHDWFSVQLSHRRASGPKALTGSPPDFQFYYLWPNTFLGTATGSGSYAVHRIDPVGVERCRLTVEFYFSDEIEPTAAQEEIELNEITLGEDKALVESVARGLESRVLASGRLLLASELLVGHFQGLVRTALAGAPGLEDLLQQA